MKSVLKQIRRFKEAGVITILAVMCIAVGIANQSFFSMGNITNMLRTASYTAIIAMPMTLILITGGIDLSVGSTMGMGGIIAGYCMVNLGLSAPVSILLALLVGAFIGFVNGIIVVNLEVPAFMGTLGTMYIVRGLINVITQAKPIYPLPNTFQSIAGSVFKFSYSVWFALILVIVFYILMQHTKLGRYAYAVGGSAETARLSGINVKTVRKVMYLLSAVFSTVAGMFVAARIGSAQIAAGEGWELSVIAACVIGGSSTLGGEGTALGSAIGAILMVVMKNAMILLQISAYWQNVIVGIILITVVAFDQYKRNNATFSFINRKKQI